MNGIEYLADTNCFIYLLDENPMLQSFVESRWAFSYITEMEILSKKGISKAEDSLIRKLLDQCRKIGHSQEITDLTIMLRRKYALKLPDAIIAATAIFVKLPVLTADRSFAQVKEIDCFIIDVD